MKATIVICACLISLLLFVPGAFSQQEPDASSTVAVCHDGQTYFIDESELQEHLDHGDTQGACDGNPQSSDDSQEPSEENEKGKQEKVTICHKGKRTLSVAQAAVQAHLDHGDTIGACPDSSDNGDGPDNTDQDENNRNQTQQRYIEQNQNTQQEDKQAQENQGKPEDNKQGNGNSGKGNDKGNGNGKGKGKS